MKHDKPLGAIVIGIIVSIPLEIIGLLFKYLGLTTITNGEACSMMFIPEGSWILGLYALPSVAAVTFVILYYLTKIIGTDYLPIKGMISGMTAYAFIFTIFGTLVKNDLMIQSPLGNMIFSLDSGLAGFLGGFLMKKYLFKNSSKK